MIVGALLLNFVCPKKGQSLVLEEIFESAESKLSVRNRDIHFTRIPNGVD